MIRSTGVLLVARVFSGATTFLVIAVIARILSRGDVAVFLVAFSLSLIIAAVGDLGLGMLAVRDGAREPALIGHLAGAILVLRASVAIPLLVLGVVIAVVLYGPAFAGVAFVATLAALLQSTAATGRAFFQARERFGITALAIILENIAWLVGVVVAAMLTRSVVMIFIAAATVFAGSAVVTFITALHGCSRSDIVAGMRGAPQVARRSVGFAAFVTVGVAQAQMDTLVAALVLASAEVAAVGVALRMFLSADYLSEAVSRASYPGLSRAAGTATHGPGVARLASILTGSGALVGGVLAVVAVVLVPLLFGSTYDDAVVPLQVLAASVPLRYLAAAYGLALTTVGHQGARAVALLVAVVAGAIVDVAAMSALGVVGIGVGVWVSAVLLLVLALALVARVPLEIHWPTVGAAATASGLIGMAPMGGPIGVTGPVLAAGLGLVVLAHARPDRSLVR